MVEPPPAGKLGEQWPAVAMFGLEACRRSRVMALGEGRRGETPGVETIRGCAGGAGKLGKALAMVGPVQGMEPLGGWGNPCNHW